MATETHAPQDAAGKAAAETLRRVFQQRGMASLLAIGRVERSDVDVALSATLTCEMQREEAVEPGDTTAGSDVAPDAAAARQAVARSLRRTAEAWRTTDADALATRPLERLRAIAKGEAPFTCRQRVLCACDAAACAEGRIPCSRCKGGTIQVECRRCLPTGGYEPCSHCNGTGKTPRILDLACPHCGDGRPHSIGQRHHRQPCRDCGGRRSVSADCGACAGKGDEPCGRCHGEGKLTLSVMGTARRVLAIHILVPPSAPGAARTRLTQAAEQHDHVALLGWTARLAVSVRTDGGAILAEGHALVPCARLQADFAGEPFEAETLGPAATLVAMPPVLDSIAERLDAAMRRLCGEGAADKALSVAIGFDRDGVRHALSDGALPVTPAERHGLSQAAEARFSDAVRLAYDGAARPTLRRHWIEAGPVLAVASFAAGYAAASGTPTMRVLATAAVAGAFFAANRWVGERSRGLPPGLMVPRAIRPRQGSLAWLAAASAATAMLLGYLAA